MSVALSAPTSRPLLPNSLLCTYVSNCLYKAAAQVTNVLGSRNPQQRKRLGFLRTNFTALQRWQPISEAQANLLFIYGAIGESHLRLRLHQYRLLQLFSTLLLMRQSLPVFQSCNLPLQVSWPLFLQLSCLLTKNPLQELSLSYVRRLRKSRSLLKSSPLFPW